MAGWYPINLDKISIRGLGMPTEIGWEVVRVGKAGHCCDSDHRPAATMVPRRRSNRMWMEGGTERDCRGANVLIYANTDWAWGLSASLNHCREESKAELEICSRLCFWGMVPGTCPCFSGTMPKHVREGSRVYEAIHH